MNELKMRVIPHFTLILDAEDGSEPKKWTLMYTYKAIAKIEKTIKKDVKKITEWQNLSSGEDFPAIVWGGLDKCNPEVTLDEVIEMLNPEAQRALSDVIFEMLFPGVAAAYAKVLEDQKTGATADPLATKTA